MADLAGVAGNVFVERFSADVGKTPPVGYGDGFKGRPGVGWDS